MFDQASELRQLVLKTARHQAEACAAPKMISVTGGQRGVGSTTVAVNLATELTRQGYRVLLVDADFQGGSTISMFTEFTQHGLISVLMKEKTIHEAITPGPLGMQVLNLGRAKQKLDVTREMQQSLIELFRQMNDHVDYIVMDIGSENQSLMRRFWLASHLVLLITTPEDQVIMSSYAMIKTLIAGHGIDSLRILINRSADEESANEVTHRMARACQRFLGYQLQSAGYIAKQCLTSDHSTNRIPWVLSQPTSPMAKSITLLSRKVLALTEHRQIDKPIENQAAHLSRSLSTHAVEE